MHCWCVFSKEKGGIAVFDLSSMSRFRVWYQFRFHIKNLRMTNILALSKDKMNIDEHLLVFKQEDKLPDRAWICNVCKIKFTNLVAVNTLLSEDFKAFVKKQIKQNDLIQIAKKRQEVGVIPEFSKLIV